MLHFMSILHTFRSPFSPFYTSLFLHFPLLSSKLYRWTLIMQSISRLLFAGERSVFEPRVGMGTFFHITVAVRNKFYTLQIYESYTPNEEYEYFITPKWRQHQNSYQEKQEPNLEFHRSHVKYGTNCNIIAEGFFLYYHFFVFLYLIFLFS